MRVAVVTDSTAYLPDGALAQSGVTVVPLSVIVDHDVYVEGEDRAVGELRRALTRAGSATTSRPAPAVFLRAYERLASEGADAIVSVHLSAQLSGTCDAARLAALDAPVPVRVVDSSVMAAALGYAALDAAAAAARGADAAAVAEVAAERARAARVLFCVASLEFLRRGGRIGAASAMLGAALAVKPLLELRDGRIELLEKQRTMGRAISRLAALAGETARASEGTVRLTVHHVGAASRARSLAEAVARECREVGAPVSELQIVELGMVGATHLGPGSLGVVIAPAG
ncbi:MAG: DegV family protein [Dermatophilaceae bacterium]